MQNIIAGKFINAQGIECLKRYQYKGSDYTVLDKALQPYWNWFVTLVPLVSLCPNHKVDRTKSFDFGCPANLDFSSCC